MKSKKKSNGTNSTRPSPRRASNGVSLQRSVAPAAVSYRSGGTEPRFSGGPGRSVRIAHREFVGTVTNGSVTSFVVSDLSKLTPGLDFNPAAATLFPWLAQVAGNFEKFKFHKLSFTLVPSQPTSSPGRYYMAVDYDWNDNPDVTKVVLMNNATVAEGPVWERLSVTADPKQLMSDMPWKFVSLSSRPNYSEPRTAYCGFLLIAFDTTTVNCQFDLIVDFDVELCIPVLEAQASVDTFSGPALASVTSVVPLAYGGYILPIADAVPMTASVIKRAIPGQGIPSSIGIGNVAVPTCLDIRGCPTTGSLTSLASLTVTGVTPNTLLAASPRIELRAYDSSGKDLGTVSSSVATIVQGPNPANNGAGAGGILDLVHTIGLAALRKSAAYATTAFLVPYLYSASAAFSAPGTLKTGVHFDL